MKTKQLFISLTLGLGLTLTLLWLLGGGTPSAQSDSPHYVAPFPTGSDSGNDCTNSSSPCATVQHAVDMADPGDEIRVAAGTYTGVRGRTAPAGYDGPSLITQVVYIDKHVTIRGGYTTAFTDPPDPEANPTMLDAEGRGRVLFITGHINPTIEGLRVTGGDAAGLGGGYSNTDAGGGVYVIKAGATISNCRIFNNIANSRGGGLYLRSSDAKLNGNTVTSNTAGQYGGGLRLYYSDATLSGNTVISNTAHEDGGGLALYSSSDAVLSGNTVISNTAHEKGGGLYLSSSDATLSGNTVISNTAITSGGGLYLYTSDATLSGNTVISNTAHEKGGGLYLSSSDAVLSGNTVISNTAITSGGGLYLYTSDATLSGNTVISNTADDGGGLYLSYSAATLSFNDITANTAYDNGGGLRLWHSAAALSGNTVILNTAYDKGGGLHLFYSAATLTNNVIADNWSENLGSGLHIEGSDPLLYHTTIANNTGGDGSGVYVTNEGSSYSTVALTNTILVGHTMGINVTAGNTATLECTLWGTDAWANDTDWGGAGTIITGTCNYWGDPAFVDSGARDYHIGLGSAAIDAGVDAGVNDDIDGDLRPMGRYDIGADELPKVFLPLAMKGYCPCGPDNYEPNDWCEQAYGPLTSGQTYQSWISCCDQATYKKSDYFYIDISTTKAINIDLTNIPDDTDYDLYLYRNPDDDPDNPLCKSEGDGSSETISCSPPAAGRYYIRVYGRTGYSTSPYSLRVTYD